VPTPLNAHAASWPQKIQLQGTTRDQGDKDNHWPIVGQSLEAQVAAACRSSAYDIPVAHGTDQISANSINCFNSGVDGNNFLMAGGNIFNTVNNCYSNTMGDLDLAKESEGHQSMLHK
jgi:hypothetical protein